MNAPGPVPETAWGRAARGLSLALLAYWGVFALAAPVTVWDAHVYNLARLLIAERGGLFHNPEWTSTRQIIFPWSFDAVHLPFLHLGFGTSLPSYFCLVGTAVVAWRLLAQRYGGDVGWVAVLVLLALPTLVFQSVGTKNDVVLLFGVAVWWQARERWREDGRRIHLVIMALAIGLTAGAKTTGIIPAAFCGALSVLTLWRSRRTLFLFGAAAAVSLLLFGSVETYVASARLFGSPLGTDDFVRFHRNNDGLRGAAANAVRYFFGNVDFDFGFGPQTHLLEKACRWCLARLHLGNVGAYGGWDGQLHFLSDSRMPGSGYGPVGMLGLFLALSLPAWAARSPTGWKLSRALAAFGLIDLTVICLTVGWMPWNNRFLLVPLVAFALGLVAFLAEAIPPPRRTAGWWALVLLALGSAIVLPVRSFNFRPSDLVGALTQRQAEECRDRPTMLPVIQAVQQWSGQNPTGVLWLIADQDSWVLPFLEMKQLRLRIVQPAEIASGPKPTKASPAVALLVLNRSDISPPTDPGRFTLLQAFSEPDSAFYEARLHR